MYSPASVYTGVQSILSEMTTYMPADSDVVGALTSLVRIQTTYGLTVGDLASGRIAGQRSASPLSAKTVFDVAVMCLGSGRPDIALQWLEHINDTSVNHSGSAIPASSLYQAFARAYAQVVTHPVITASDHTVPVKGRRYSARNFNKFNGSQYFRNSAMKVSRNYRNTERLSTSLVVRFHFARLLQSITWYGH